MCVAIYRCRSIWIETGGEIRVYGRCSFRDGRGEDGTRGGDTSCDATENLWYRVLTLSGCARKTGRVQLAKQQGLQATRRSHRARRCRALNASKGGRGEGGGGGGTAALGRRQSECRVGYG
jgi:hypothetical protein